ncbi:MAG: DUF4430 domain-containing protein [Christensenellaceae bacterium]|jgi:hypothetical protein|nr:DUF4430 domain-containing protein [Christensenellaceae bacterium]
MDNQPQNKRPSKISLYINIALAVVLVGLMIWTLIPAPKVAVKNISISILDESAVEIKFISSKDYKSNLVADILKENKSVMQLGYTESSYGMLITSAMGKDDNYDWGAGTGYAWAFEVNFQQAAVGVSAYRVKDGDVIVLRYVDASYWGY